MAGDTVGMAVMVAAIRLITKAKTAKKNKIFGCWVLCKTSRGTKVLRGVFCCLDVSVAGFLKEALTEKLDNVTEKCYTNS